MALENQWVTYLQRSYKSIKASLINRLQSLVPEITDYNESSNLFILIISMFAGLVEQLNYYIDNVARESFLPTARRYSSIIKISRLFDYRVKAKIGATVDLKFTVVDSSGNPFSVSSDVTLNSGIIVKDDDGIPFTTLKKATIFSGGSYVNIPARQGTLVSGQTIGTTNGSANQTLPLDDNYRDGSLQITINSITWTLKETLGFSGPNDQHFIVDVDESKQAYVKFGDGVNGAIPSTGLSVIATYYTCVGENGNVDANTLVNFDSSTKPATPTGANDWQVTNELSAVNGQEEEGIEEIRKHAPLSIRTLERAVTLQDHKDMGLLVPGVGKASVYFDIKSKSITFYIAPEEGGTASSALLTDVEDYFANKIMLTTTVNAVAAGEAIIKLDIEATAKFRRDATDTENDIKQALADTFGYNNSDINKPIRKSDIIALIDNLDKVDYLYLNEIYMIPYPRIHDGTNPLENNWRVELNDNLISKKLWRIVVITSSIARLYEIDEYGRDIDYHGEITIHATDPGSTDHTSNGGGLELAIWGTFSIGDEWRFTTYPYNEDQVVDDNSIPVYDETELTINVNSQNI